MAFPAFRSHSVVNITTSGSDFVFTKPSGLAVGDYMVVGLRFLDGGSQTISTPSGWNLLFTTGSANNASYYFDKIADSADVAAGSFTFVSSSGLDRRVGYCAAFSGVVSRQDFDIGSLGLGVVSGSVTVDPLTNESLVLVTLAAADFNLTNPLTTSGCTLTPTTSLTERVDEGFAIGSGGSKEGISVFLYSGEYTGLTQITGFEFTISEAITSSVTGGVIILNGVQNVTADIGRIDATPTLYGATAAVDVSTDIGHLEVEPELYGITGKASSDGTQWTNPDKPSTTWRNPSK